MIRDLFYKEIKAETLPWPIFDIKMINNYFENSIKLAKISNMTKQDFQIVRIAIQQYKSNLHENAVHYFSSIEDLYLSVISKFINMFETSNIQDYTYLIKLNEHKISLLIGIYLFKEDKDNEIMTNFHYLLVALIHLILLDRELMNNFKH